MKILKHWVNFIFSLPFLHFLCVCNKSLGHGKTEGECCNFDVLLTELLFMRDMK